MTIKHTRGRAKITGVSSLTDNMAGVANDTLQAIPDTSGVLLLNLINDINANTLPAIRNNLADLAAKVNVIITALKANGILGD